ncbi:MAG: hypothetical protein J1F28_02530 [Oscillospiraceae bacterium]|nr:hypothetical protein [Oscillospiraceae bacterium]
MVCNTTQSAFYRVITEYNNSCSEKGKNCSEFCEEIHEKNCGKNCENSPDKFKKKHTEKPYENNCGNYSKNYNNIPGKNSNRSPSDIFSDSDFLLICALIYILYKNGADQKIILALIFVLIS